MMNKILVTVVVPMIDEKYDIYLPISKPMSVVKELLVKTINELSEGHFPIKEKNILMSSSGVLYNKNVSIKECGIKNGDKIILL